MSTSASFIRRKFASHPPLIEVHLAVLAGAVDMADQAIASNLTSLPDLPWRAGAI